METLTCSTGHEWQREPKPGRKPKTCPDCFGKPVCKTRGCKSITRKSQLLDQWWFCANCKTMMKV